MITWRLHLKMAEKRMKIIDLARVTGLAPETVSKYYHDKGITAVEMDTLEAFCKALDCQPGDLLVYVPDGEESRPEG
ncbi:MAG: helix-turn-helix transcriptional regulator [Firmicutes bacterium]|nr:helix-turn-helix transcriptional regulator [Bacillota bacterium]